MRKQTKQKDKRAKQNFHHSLLLRMKPALNKLAALNDEGVEITSAFEGKRTLFQKIVRK